ncbi:MAG: HAMP domain-containing histidine kinase [Planctomycetia bacterium]|nr:HAMP domain-containing histidine kinase [Planctomycetia bacterium]
MRRSLRSQILYPFAGLTAVAVVAVSAAGAWRAATVAEARIEAHVRSAADVLLTAGFPLTDAVLRQTHGLSGAEFVYANEHGDIRASSFETVPRAWSDAVSSVANVEGSSSVSNAPTNLTLDGIEYLHWRIERVARRAEDAGRTLHILYPQEQRRQMLREAIGPPLMVGALALVAAFALSYLLAARIGKPIAAVREQFRKLAAGDYARLSLPTRDDEVRDLVAAADTLAVQLAERDLAVQRSARSALLGRLSGGLCHHLRNAAAGAKLAVQLHRRRCDADDSESLAVALRQLDFAEQYVQRLLTLGKPQPLRLQRLDLREVVADAVSLVAPTFKHRDIELRTILPAVPMVHEAADREQLRQLLVNLLLNAVDAAGDRGWASVEVAAGERDLRIIVADGGPGPPPEVAAKLFEPFVTGKPDGIGLGLAATREIARLHGGEVAFARRPYTCFEVVLPNLAKSESSSLGVPLHALPASAVSRNESAVT